MVTGLESRLKAAVGKEQGKAPRVEEWYSTPQGKILSNVFSLFKMLPPHPTYSIPLFAFGAYCFSWQFGSWAVSLAAWFLLVFWGGCSFPVSSIRHFYKLLWKKKMDWTFPNLTVVQQVSIWKVKVAKKRKRKARPQISSDKFECLNIE